MEAIAVEPEVVAEAAAPCRECLPAVIEPSRGVPLDAARLLTPGGEYREIAIVEGRSIQELLDGTLPKDMHGLVRAYANGTLVADRESFHPRPGDRILLAVVPQGGGGNSKSIIGAVLAIAISVFAPYAGAAIATSIGASAAVGTAIGVGITMVGTMVVSALVAPPTVNTGSIAASSPKSYTLSGQSNQARPFGACFVVYGRHRVMPIMAANPNIDNFGSASTLSALYDFGLGYVTLEDIRIGDVAIEQYTPNLFLHQNSDCRDLRLLTARVGYDQYALNLARNAPVTIRTKMDTYCADLDLQFPKGIFQAAPAFGQIPFWADFASYWRPVGGATWQEVPIDWYVGPAWDRQYVGSGESNIYFSLPEMGLAWTPYDPATGVATLRSWDASYRAAHGAENVYAQSRPNPNLIFSYPGGPIDEANYFARYPDTRRAGWEGTAQAHFEAIGSREGRDPGVPVFIYPLGDYTFGLFSGMQSALHQHDGMQSDPLVGGWGWIQAGSPPPVVENFRTPFQWMVYGSPPFNGANYLARYPDVAAAGIDPWQHFTNNGAFEGRDPYVRVAARSVRLTAMFVGPYWMRIFLQFPTPGEYEIQIMRTDKIEDGTDNTINQTSGGAVTARFNESTVALLRSYQAGDVVLPRLRHTMLEMRVTATDQLQGVVQNLSAIATSMLPVTSDGINFQWAPTRNPAWIALDILCSEKNPKPLSHAQIDWPSWLHLAQVADAPRSWVANGMPFTAPRYTCDTVVADFSTVKQLVESVLACARASLILTTSGLWGVLHDEEKATPRQLLTPANSWGFSGNRTFTQTPHCLRVNYVNRDNAWTKDELPVYADGYNMNNATIFETLDTFGVTDYPHAWAYGRYMLAQGIQRSELFTLTLDVENLLVQRGDLVLVAHDVPRIGGVPSRIDRLGWAAGPNGGGLIHCALELAAAPTGFSIRRADGTIISGRVLSAEGGGVFELDNLTGVEVDNLIVLGEYTRETQPYLVQRIAPSADLTAELTLCKYAPGVYTADQGALPPWEPGFGQDYINGTDLACIEVSASQTLYYVVREPRVDVLLQWRTTGFAFDHHEIAVILPSSQRRPLDVEHKPQNFQWSVDALRERDYFDLELQFEIMPVNTLGFRGVPGYVTIVLVPDRTPPAAVIVFGVNVQSEHVDIFWEPPDEPDISHYLLRYTPVIDYPNWDASQQLATIGWPNTKTSAGARTGSYGIRVQDTSGNVSDVVWRRTTIAMLPDINVITAINDRNLVPAWPGKRNFVDVLGYEIALSGEWGEVAPEGIYLCARPVDLGDVYESRVSSKIEAYGVTADDYMAAWASLADVRSLVSATADLWNAWLEVRTADEMLVMAEWLPSIAGIDPISAGDDSVWSEWRPCTVGDFTGQLLQFRIRMQSFNPGVRVVCKSGRVEVDMPDRIDAYGDVDVPVAGLDFVFPVAFRELEAVAITINGNADPVVAEVSSKQSTGFHVDLRNTLTHALTDGYIDILAQGYGRRRPTSI